jgi:Zn-dependent protease with chaperone function
MITPEARQMQVVLTGKRLAASSTEELIVRIRARFKLTDAQAAAMLGSRCVVKSDIDAVTAVRFVAALRELGLEALAEELPREPATHKQSPRAPAVNREAPPRARAAHRAAPTVAPAPMSGAIEAAKHRPPQPSKQAATKPTAAPSLAALQALAGQRLPRPPTTSLYVFGLFAITLLCVALPALYIGLTGAIAFGWFWYLTHIHHHLPRNVYLIALMYAAPGLAGAVLVLFLARPLFAPRPRPPELLELDPHKEAGFVAGVHSLCRAIGVSPPIEIRLSWNTNASVHFRNGWFSLFTGHKVLTIGLSMVAGLSARQFVGVLAHEFGHFAQRFGMICTFIVNSINAWLEHCAYGDDAWERKLSAWSEQANEKDNWFSGLVGLSVWATWFAIRAARHVMAALFHACLRLSAYMSRQMEFDADRYEALLSGSQMFRTTARSLRALNHAFGEVHQANIEAWQDHKLLRDLPEAVAAHAAGFDAPRLARIEDEMSDETMARYWDSHPPDVARIENAEQRRAAGIYLEEAPATQLFCDFAALSQRATREFYTSQEVAFTAEHLRPSDEILGHMRHRNQRREQIGKFFNGQFQEWPLIQLRVSSTDEAELPGWQECIDRIRASSPDIARHWTHAMQAHGQRPLLRTAVSLGASSRQLGLPGPDRSAEELRLALERTASHRMDFQESLHEAFALYAVRIQHAIQVMESEGREQATQMRATLIAMAALQRETSELEELAGAMRAFGSIAQSSGAMPSGITELESKFSDLAGNTLARADRIPQTVATGNTVGAYLRSRCRTLPPAGTAVEPHVFVRAAWGLPDAFHQLYLLTLGELVNLCEAAEHARGIRPIRLVA